VTSIDRTAYPAFKRMASRDPADVFTPSDDEIEWAWDKSSADARLPALMVWLRATVAWATCRSWRTCRTPLSNTSATG
jgi:hypothetical protein